LNVRELRDTFITLQKQINVFLKKYVPIKIN